MPLSTYPIGKNPLAYLLQWIKTDWKYGLQQGWVTAFERLQDALQRKNEVTSGGIVTEGASLAAGALFLNVTAIDAIINGKIKVQSAADSDVDYLVTAGTVGQPIFADGSDASALLLASDESAYCTLVVTNSDGAGGVNDGDNSATLAVIVVAGTSSTYDEATAHLTSAEIQAALDASTSIHDGVTGWAHVAQILFDNPSGTPGTTIVMNRNNTVSDA